MTPLLLILLSDLITFFSFPPHPLGPLMLVGLVPVFITVDRASTWKQAFFRMWLYGFLGNAAICFWVGYTLKEFSSFPWWLSYSCLLGLSIFEQMSMAIVMALRHRVRDKLGHIPIFFTPVVWMLLDSLWPRFFPNTLGYGLYNVPIINQSADLLGVWGLTGLVVYFSEWIALKINRGDHRRHQWPAVGFLLLMLVYGSVRFFQFHDKKPETSVKFALIQPNVSSQTKTNAEGDNFPLKNQLVDEILDLSRSALSEEPDVIFWPETSFPTYFHSDYGPEYKTLTAKVDQFVFETGLSVLVGAKDFQNFREYNGLHLVEPGSGVPVRVQKYYKHVLLPVGEYVPFGDILPWLHRIFRQPTGGAGGRFAHGEGAKVFLARKRDTPPTQTGTIRLGPMICYEGLFPKYVRKIGRLNPHLLINATNDSWYGPGMEPDLHLYLTSLRSIELRIPLVRATNTGYTAVVDIDGSLLLKTQLFEPAVDVIDVPIYENIWSPFKMWGVIPLWIAFFLMAGWVWLKRRQSFRLPRH